MSDISFSDDARPKRVYNADDVDAYVKDLLAELDALRRDLAEARSDPGAGMASPAINFDDAERLIGRVMMQAYRAAQDTEAEAIAKARTIIEQAQHEADAIRRGAPPVHDTAARAQTQLPSEADYPPPPGPVGRGHG